MELDHVLRDHLHRTAAQIEPPKWSLLDGPKRRAHTPLDTSGTGDPLPDEHQVVHLRQRRRLLLAAAVIVLVAVGLSLAARSQADHGLGVATTPDGSALPTPGSSNVPPSIPERPAPPPEPDTGPLRATTTGPSAGGSRFDLTLSAPGGSLDHFQFRATSTLQRWSGARWATTNHLVVNDAGSRDAAQLCGDDERNPPPQSAVVLPARVGDGAAPYQRTVCEKHDFTIGGGSPEHHLLPESVRAGTYRLCRKAVPDDIADGPVDLAATVVTCAQFAVAGPPAETTVLLDAPCPGTAPGPSNPEAANGVTDAQYLANINALPEIDRVRKMQELELVRADKLSQPIDGQPGWVSFRQQQVMMLSNSPYETKPIQSLAIYDDACRIIGYLLRIPLGNPTNGATAFIPVSKDAYESPDFDPRNTAVAVDEDVPPR